MKQTEKKKKTSKAKRIFKDILFIFLILIVAGVVAVSGIIIAIIKSAPELKTNEILDLNETSVIYDDKQQPMDDVIVTDDSGQVVKRTVVTLSDTSPYLSKAFVAIEDERFYKHNGVDYRGVSRAVLIDLQNKLFHKNKTIQGASTITQQLIKNRMFLTDSLNDRLNYKRKIQEAYLATELEKKLSKNEILEAYMNTIFLGGNAHGVEAAANQYFGVHASNLTLIQSAFIAGIAQSPSYYYPFANPARTNTSIYINKTKLVLDKMYETNSISRSEYEDAVNELNTKGKIVFTTTKTTSDKYNYEWFSRPVMQQIRSDLMSQYNCDPQQANAILLNGGLKIYTTMDKNLQDKSQKTLKDDPVFNQVVNSSTNQIQASAVIMDYHTGEVKSIVGGRADQPANSYNRAADVVKFHRPTGSSIKPITVYGAAFDTKKATPDTIVDDSALPASVSARYNNWDLRDDDGSTGIGKMPITKAIMLSRNLVAARLEDQIGLDTGATYAEKFGIKLTSTDKRSLAAMALGQINGTNTLAMAAAYGVFGNSGMYATPRLYTKVVDKTGHTILETKYTTKKAIDPQTAYIMWKVLQGPTSPYGTGYNAKYGDMPVAGKTGTTTNKKDLWFCGLTPYYSAAVWIGNDDNKVFDGLSSNSSAQLWADLMKEANKNLPVKDLDAPTGVPVYNYDFESIYNGYSSRSNTSNNDKTTDKDKSKDNTTDKDNTKNKDTDKNKPNDPNDGGSAQTDPTNTDPNKNTNNPNTNPITQHIKLPDIILH